MRLLVLFVFVLGVAHGQVRYSIPEEMNKGSVVGNIVQDLGLDVKRLKAGRARIFTEDSREYIGLNVDKGTLVVRERIDREELCAQVTPCSIHFQIILENPMELHRIDVEIVDINDHAPVFETKEINIDISELALPGARFSLDNARDPDVGMNALQRYTLNPTDHFTLKELSRNDGTKYVEMVLQTPLDREHQEEHKLILIAFDGGTPQKSGTVKITVTVIDANDNPPVFSQPVYRVSVPENAPKGSIVMTVTATDKDDGANGEVTYSFSQSTGKESIDLFRMNSNTGDISVSGSLDYEKAKQYEINVQARDKGGLTDTSKVLVEITDVNDNAPVISVISFSNPIPEDSAPDTVIAMLNIKDIDSGKNGQIQCSVTSHLPFRIKSSSSNFYSLVTDQLLDREKLSEYNITVTAADEGSPSFSTNKTLQLKISDVNDNAPVFQRQSYTAYVLENNTPGVSVFAVTASDRDSGNNARISYFLEDVLVNGVSASTYFSVHAESGEILAVRSFDYEQTKEFNIRVKAQDGGNPPLSSNVSVRIIIQDQNDNAPQVLYPVQTGSSAVAEMVPRSADVGYLVTKVVAVDVDSGQNAWLSYKLQKATDRALFEVGLQNGEIRTVRQVTDKDAVKQKLTVVVEDNGQPSRSATVNINVAVADSFPEVLSEFTDFTHDKDYNDNLTFYLVLALAVVSFLFIVSIIAILSVKCYRWRRERMFYKSGANLPVIPYYPPLYADVGGTGTLQHVYNYEVCRTTDSRKSDLKYARPSSESIISLDTSGTQTLTHAQKQKLRHDSEEQLGRGISSMDVLYSLSVWNISSISGALRRPMPLLVLFVFVLGVARGQVRYSIPEEMNKGSVVGNIVQDLGLDVKRLKAGRARIFTEDSREYIGLNVDKGTLVVRERIDREELCAQVTPCSIHFQIILENPMELHRIDVEIVDINDHAPVFDRKDVSIEIKESMVAGSLFSLESAHDPDVGQNTLQRYTLNPADQFTLKELSHSDGTKYVEMVLQTPLDREHQEEHKLILTAFDGGTPQKSGTVKITVTVIDANDNPPVFSQPVYRVSVPENAPKGSIVMTVTATDKDKGANGEVTYSFSQSTRNAIELFTIDQDTGEIRINGLLDYEKSKQYDLNIKAIDKGGLSDTSKVLVEITDVNDNAPVISVISFSNPIPEDSAPDTVIAMLNIKDIDSGKNGQIQCSVTSHLPFRIKSSSSNFYTLVTDQLLDREKLSEYNITVTAADEGSPSFSTNKTLQLKISDVNDNAPVFQSQSYTAYVLENNTPGVSVFAVTASDRDSGNNARISYFLEDVLVNGVSASTYFSVHAESGEILAVRSFDYEQTKEFNIRVKAQDGGNPPLSSNVSVRIIIQDQNDNAPQVLYPVQTGSSAVAEMVPRSADVGYLVTKVVAVDVDSGQNAWLSYKLQKATDRALFEVGLQNGEIRTVRQVTDKDAVKQKLTVVVEDNGQPSRSATVNINVAVADSFPEVLSEFTDFTHDKDYNDNLTFYLVLALAVVSFLFIVSIIAILSVKCYRWRRERMFYKSGANLPVIPYYPPLYADVGGTGTLQHVYNYEVCRTTDSRKSDLKYARPSSESIISLDGSGTQTLTHAQKQKLSHDSEEQLGRGISSMDVLYSLSVWSISSVSGALRRPMPLLVLFVFVLGVAHGQVRYSIPEEMNKGSVVGNIVQDLGLDVKRLKAGRARIFTEDSREYIGLNVDKGTLVVRERIDREELCAQVTPCSIHFQIILENPMELHRIDVEIVDINDHAPVFDRKDVSIEIKESMVAGSLFSLESAHDPDVGQNTLQRYTLNPADHFILKELSHSDGTKYVEMVLQTPLDREHQEEHKLILTAFDGGTPQKSGIVKITVTVIDANDNPPVFSQPVYRVSVPENAPKGSIVMTVTATDKDKGANGDVTYSFSQSTRNAIELFTIDQDTGEIRINGLLDYEKSKQYDLNIKAMDKGGLSDTSKVLVEITDVNDNAPVISVISFSNPIPEDSAPDTVIAMLNIKDIDSGKNGQIQCSVTSHLPFRIKSSSSNFYTLVTDQLLDLEDNGQPSRSATVNINVAVADSFPEVLSEFTDFTHDKDYNDNLTFYLVLALAVVSFLFIVSIIAILSVKCYRWRRERMFYKSGANLPVIPYYPPLYADVGGTGTLQHVYNYDLCGTADSRKSDMKYVRPGSHSIISLDGSGTQTLLRLQEPNNLLGESENQVRYSVPEEMPTGSFVGDIVKDLGLEPQRITAGKARIFTASGREYVELDRDKGHIIVKERIDREVLCSGAMSTCSISFEIILENPIELYRVTVEILDVNDNSPAFPRGEIKLEISESASVGARFSVDSALDPDVGLNGIQGYSIHPTDHFSLKTQSRTGSGKNVELVLQSQLDRETEEQLYLTVTATDGGNPKRSGTVKIHIVVLDINDNAPMFSKHSYRVSVPENAAQGALLLTVNATDADTMSNAHIGYYFEHTTPKIRDLFSIDASTGDIRLAGELDFEEATVHEFKVQAKDQGGLSDSAEVVIEVTDVNDNAPKITLMSFSNTLPENSPPGTVVAMINVQDGDAEENGKVTCSIDRSLPFRTESSLNHYYSIVTDSSLDREQMAEYNITITAKDGGLPPLSSTKTLSVKISDINDHSPEFEHETYAAYVLENNLPTLSLLSVKAHDADLGANARISYFLMDKDFNGALTSSLVSIDAGSGVIYALKSFDYEQIKSFSITVKAQDGGSPPLSTNATVNFIIQDQNDNAPQVLYPVQTGSSAVAEMVPRSADVGYLVTKVVAVDVDSGQNAWLSYKLQKATDRALFEVGLQNGEIRTVRQVTDKDAVKQKLTVVVEDNGQPSRSATVNINVAVADSFPEVLSEFTDFTHDKDYNDNLTFYLVLALAVVSFLFIVSIIAILSVKCYRWRRERMFYKSGANLPVIPYYPPLYADVGGTGTLKQVYNYELCGTADSRKSDMKFVRSSSQSVLSVDLSGTRSVPRPSKHVNDPDVDTEVISGHYVWGLNKREERKERNKE
ncbi:hypothetical protein NFI96_015231 [Prochilodus magdalenae]|nr:hypothetical protein NFI96_015231 [Prochilodus magdalenae]